MIVHSNVYIPVTPAKASPTATNPPQNAAREHANLLTKAGRARRELTQWARAGFPLVPPAERRRRDAICAACAYYNVGGNWGWGECQAPGCGCTKVKRSLATASCPLKSPKWGPWKPA